jgi:putative membrane protein
MTPLSSRSPLGQITSMAGAIALLLGMVAGLHAVAGDDDAALRDPPPAAATPTQGQTPELRTAAATLSADEKAFIETALKGGIAEVQEVGLAQKKAADPDLRNAAAHLEKDHKALNAKLSRIGSQHGLALPTEPSAERKALYDKLQKLPADQFDAQFLQAGADAHKKTIALFERTQSGSANPEIKALAGETLPTLKKHLSMLEGLQGHGKAAPGSN